MADEPLSITWVDDYSGSGRVTILHVNDVPAWTWAWHIDGPPSDDALSLLRALGWRD